MQMQELDDIALLRQYTEQNSGEAFATLVTRHVNKVYSVALRHTRNPHSAEEITQAVFVIFARKADKLRHRAVLSGWLYETSRLTAVTFIRSEIRRARREQEAHMQTLLNENDSEVWPQIAPLLDAAMAGLNETDRHAVVLRFFDGKSMKEVGAALGASEDAAKMRLNRAVEKLRKFFTKRGIILPATILTAAISANSVQAAPVTLAKTVAAVAIAKGAAASGSTLTLIKGALKIMAWTKMKAVIVTSAVVLLAAGTTTVAIKVIHERPMVVQGKTESEWIKSIVYNGDDSQIKLWHSLGSKGIQMLVRALKSPASGRDIRMRAADLLCQLEDTSDDKSAIPEIINMLQTEKDDQVRALELGYFEAPIQSMPEKEKAALFPELLRGLQSKAPDVRNNSLVALQYYPNQTDIVVPLMIKSLQDSDSQVRLMAVKALNHIDPQNSAQSDLVPVLVGCLADSQGAANDAAIMLGELHREPDLAVPALIQSLQSPEAYVRNNSAAALGKFGSQAKSAVPALQKALEDSDRDVRFQAAAALKRINAGAAAN